MKYKWREERRLAFLDYNRYVFKIKGGNDKQGLHMKNGVFVNRKVRVLLKPDNKCFRPWRDKERKPSLACNFSYRFFKPDTDFSNPDLEFSDPSLSMNEKALQTMFSLLSVSWLRSPRRNSFPSSSIPMMKGIFIYNYLNL